jgi:hypothetical protein
MQNFIKENEMTFKGIRDRYRRLARCSYRRRKINRLFS